MSRSLTARVIGNAAYEGGSKLQNPGHDADDLASQLEACGFEVVKLIDGSNADLDRALKRFKQAFVGKVVVEQQMSVTLSTDHRCIDGALGAEFLGAIKMYLEEPGLMLV